MNHHGKPTRIPRSTQIAGATLATLGLLAVASATSGATTNPQTPAIPSATSIAVSTADATYRNAILTNTQHNTATTNKKTSPQKKNNTTKKANERKDRNNKADKKKTNKKTSKNTTSTTTKTPDSTCKDPLARIILDTGFTGNHARLAWSIVMRESHGKPLDENSRYFTGALGAWQIQTSAWSHQPWWSRTAMLDIPTQTRIVYKHLTNRGQDFGPWGVSHVTRNGEIIYDFTNYSGWTTSQRQNWIIAPLQRFWRQYPC